MKLLACTARLFLNMPRVIFPSVCVAVLLVAIVDATERDLGQIPKPTNVRIVLAPFPAVPLSSITVDTRHPRMHFTPESLPTWRSWLAGPLKPMYQAYVTRVGALLGKETVERPAINVDFYALIWLAGSIPGIDYGAGRSPETFGVAALEGLRKEMARGVPNPDTENNYAEVNHPFHSGSDWLSIIARAHDWMYTHPAYTVSEKTAVASYLLDACRYLLVIPLSKTGRTLMSFEGPGDAFDLSPGSEAHHPWYYVLPLVGDKLVDETEVRKVLATFESHWLNGAWLDVGHFESQGAGTRALGGYGSWYPERLIINFHAWKTATGQDYFNSATALSSEAGYFRNFPLTYGVLRKPQAPSRLFPLGQSSGDVGFPTGVMQMLTGVLVGQPARLAAGLVTTPTTGTPAVALPILLTYDPTVAAETLPHGITHFKTYGLVIDRRADQTVLTMGAPVIRLKGHTWTTQGGGAKNGIPLGVTLQVKGVPVLVKHVGDHRGAMPAFGQNAVRVYDPLAVMDVGGASGGFSNLGTAARRVHQVKDTDYLGGITGYTAGDPNRAVANLTKWYDSKLVTSYTRTYEWGANFLRVIDDIETTRPDIMVWSRWYTGHPPVADGTAVPTGVSSRPAPLEIGLGPVRWQITTTTATELHTVGGTGYEWVDDAGKLWSESSDMSILKNMGALEIGTYTLTLKSRGNGRTVHLFTW